MPRSDIPMGPEFGPNQIDLVKVLELAQEHNGSKQEFIAAVGQEYGWPLATAKNTLLSMKKYLLLDEDNQLTEEGKKLLSLKSQRVQGEGNSGRSKSETRKHASPSRKHDKGF